MSRFRLERPRATCRSLANPATLDYDEEDDGFAFSRVKKKRPDSKAADPREIVTRAQVDAPNIQPQKTTTRAVSEKEDVQPKPKERRKRLSFASPRQNDDPPPRRSKRLSKDGDQAETAALEKPTRKERPKKEREHDQEPLPQENFQNATKDQQRQQTAPVRQRSPTKPARGREAQHEDERPRSEGQADTVPNHEANHSATRIALPVADTPVNTRNKAMREGKSGKGERRDSLGSRGRRASSLIESGTSNGA
jgi:kinetochore protein Mis13/DSN1